MKSLEWKPMLSTDPDTNTTRYILVTESHFRWENKFLGGHGTASFFFDASRQMFFKKTQVGYGKHADVQWFYTRLP